MLNSKEYIKPNTEFSFRIIFNRIAHYEHIINALKGLVFFGGLGTRSRRGGGSFWIKDLVCSEELKGYEQGLILVSTLLMSCKIILHQTLLLQNTQKMIIRI